MRLYTQFARTSSIGLQARCRKGTLQQDESPCLARGLRTFSIAQGVAQRRASCLLTPPLACVRPETGGARANARCRACWPRCLALRGVGRDEARAGAVISKKRARALLMGWVDQQRRRTPASHNQYTEPNNSATCSSYDQACRVGKPPHTP
eukprot:359745-Pleurochrysis_carterae.AAC.2